MRVTDKGVSFETEYSIEEHGYRGNGWDDAGQATVVSITEAWGEDGNPIELSDDLRERLEAQIAETIDNEPAEDFYDDRTD